MHLASLLALLVLGDPSTTRLTSIDREAVRAPILRAMPAIRACRDLAWAKEGARPGRIVLTFAIDRRGGVTIENIQDSTGSPTLVRCVCQVFSRIVYSQPPIEEIHVTYPLNFV
jgi:hypothetical protein